MSQPRAQTVTPGPAPAPIHIARDAEANRPIRLQPPAPSSTDPPGLRIPKSRGTSTLQAGILMASEMFGGGLLVLPKAFSLTGWAGIPILIIICLVAAFNGKRLGDCWSYLENRNPDLRCKIRNPYTVIAETMLGRKWGVVVSVALVVTKFGAGVVYLLLAADIVTSLATPLISVLNICFWYLIITCTITPLALFVLPKDFIFLGFFATFTASGAYLLYFIALVMRIRPFVYRYGAHGFTEFFLGVGMMMFSFGGASSFPTIQTDMADATKYNKSLKYSFMATLALYLAVAITGYAVLGDETAPNFAISVDKNPLSVVVNVIMTCHLISTFIVFINPVCYDMERLYGAPRDFYCILDVLGIPVSLGHRMLVRLSIMAAVLIVGESIPRFHTILALLGGSTITLLAFIMPSYCFLNMDRVEDTDDEDSDPPPQPPPPPPVWMRVVCWEVIGAGILVACFVSVCSLMAMFGSAQVLPCYFW